MNQTETTKAKPEPEEHLAEPEADLTLNAEEKEADATGERKEEAEVDASEQPAEIQEDAGGYYHDGGKIFAEDLEDQMAVLPEIVNTTEEVKIEDIQAGDPQWNTPEEISASSGGRTIF